MNIDKKDRKAESSASSEMVLPLVFVVGLFALLAVLSQIS